MGKGSDTSPAFTYHSANNQPRQSYTNVTIKINMIDALLLLIFYNWIWLLKWWSNPDLMGHIGFRAKSWVPWLEPVELAFGLIALCAILALCIPEQQLDKLSYISSFNMVFLFLPIVFLKQSVLDKQTNRKWNGVSIVYLNDIPPNVALYCIWLHSDCTDWQRALST